MAESHMKDYKNKGKDQNEMRRHRAEVAVALRKTKREEVLSKRRNISEDVSSDSDDMIDADLHKIVTDGKDVLHPEVQKNALHQANKIIATLDESSTKKLITFGFLPVLLNCLKQNDIVLQYEAAYALANLAAGETELTMQIVETGAVPPLIHLLSSPVELVSSQVLWALTNIIGEGIKLRDYVIQNGFLQPMLSIAVNPNTPVLTLRTVAWCIRNMCAGNEQPLTYPMLLEVLPVVNNLIRHTDLMIVLETLRALRFMTDVDDYHIELLIGTGILPTLLQMLKHTDIEVIHLVLHISTNITAGTDQQTQSLLDLNFLAIIPELLAHSNDKVRKITIWTISNIAGGTQLQKQAIMDSGIFAPIVSILRTGTFPLQKETLWTINNLVTNSNADFIFAAINGGFLGPLCDLLTCQDLEAILLILDSLDNILEGVGDRYKVVANIIEECQGLDKIELIQLHENVQAYELAFKIVQKFFSEDKFDFLSFLAANQDEEM